MVFRMLFDDVGAPAGNTTTRECGHERPWLETQRLQDERGVELDIRPEVAPRLHLLEHLQNRLLGRARQIEQVAVFERRRSQLVGDLTQHVGPRITHLVDAVPEPHDAPRRRQLVAHPRLGPIG